jgi:imidazolonepropionase-like amidohydrolase
MRGMRMRFFLHGLVILATGLTVAGQTGGPSSAAASLVLTRATVVDGTGGPPIANAVIVIRDGRIVDVGPASRVKVPSGVQRLDMRGKTVLPGFVNAHGHANETSGLQSGPQFNTRENILRQLTLYAQYGITSVFSLGGDGAAGLALRDEPTTGRARIFVSGAIVTGKTPEAAAAEVDALATAKVDWVKVRVDGHLGAGSMPLPAAKGAIDRAHSHGLPLAAHLYYLADANQLLRDGVDLIAHSVRDKDVDAEFIRLARARDVCVVPTLMREVSTFVYETEPAFFADPFFQRHADAAAVEQLKTPARQQTYRAPAAQANKAALEQASRNVKLLKDAGVRIAMGTDSGPAARFQGYFEHMELELMVKAGLTPMQTIVAATGDAARCMKKAGQIGTIQPGAWADLVVYGANPVDDIRNTRALEHVFIGGVLLPPAPTKGRANERSE